MLKCLFYVFFFIHPVINFSQVQYKSIHRKNQISFTIYCYEDSLKVYIGEFKVKGFVNCGNSIQIDKKKQVVIENDSILIDFVPDSSVISTSDFLVLEKGQILKIRILPQEKIKVHKQDSLTIRLQINDSIVFVNSRRYNHRFKRIQFDCSVSNYVVI